MSDRSWFYASQGQQQGPFPEVQFRNLIARGTITPDTLVWTDGMAGWQRAGDIPSLAPGAGARPPVAPQAGSPVATAAAGGLYHATGQDGDGSLWIDFEILEFTWRSIVLGIGIILVIPAVWAVFWYLKWIVRCVRVPGRPNFSFAGKAMTLVPWYFGAIFLEICCRLPGIFWLSTLTLLIPIALYWLFLKWFVANLASDGQPLGLSFVGSPWAALGWFVLLAVSFITIIGWAWVYVASIRWFCRNIEGSQREIIFNGTGLEFLWRSVVIGLASLLIIPIPWMYRWKMQWLASQTVLVERNTRESV